MSLIEDLKLFRILVILWGFSARFCDISAFIYQLLFSAFEAQAHYTCCKDPLYYKVSLYLINFNAFLSKSVDNFF